MDIYTKPGTKIVVTETSAKNGYTSDENKVAAHLTIGVLYTVERMEVDSWSSEVYLEEFPNIPFNSVNFENI